MGPHKQCGENAAFPDIA